MHQPQNFDEFAAAARAQGFDEILQREWDAGLVLATHRHPFAVHARVARGEVWLTVGEGDEARTCHLPAGEAFDLPPGVPHAERYGAQGATFWVARRHAAAPQTP
jgi:quercetin dioxygenase-like cupin family protein